MKGRVLDPEGRPLTGVHVRGLADWWDSWTGPLATADFEVTGMAPGDVRQLAFLQRERRLSGLVILKGPVQAPIEVKLEHWGSVTGRLVDAAGQPRAGVALGWMANQKAGSRSVRDPSRIISRPMPMAGSGSKDWQPGLKYELQILGNGGFFGAVFKDLTIKAGESRDLGDVKNLDE